MVATIYPSMGCLVANRHTDGILLKAKPVELMRRQVAGLAMTYLASLPLFVLVVKSSRGKPNSAGNHNTFSKCPGFRERMKLVTHSHSF